MAKAIALLPKEGGYIAVSALYPLSLIPYPLSLIPYPLSLHSTTKKAAVSIDCRF